MTSVNNSRIFCSQTRGKKNQPRADYGGYGQGSPQGKYQAQNYEYPPAVKKGKHQSQEYFELGNRNKKEHNAQDYDYAEEVDQNRPDGGVCGTVIWLLSM